MTPEVFGSGVDLLQRNETGTEMPRQVVGNGLSDDDFFHITCHIDPSLKAKLESGKFVDLDKLLPKDGNFGKVVASNKTKIEWLLSKGSMYLVPAKSVSRVNCFCRWE